MPNHLVVAVYQEDYEWTKKYRDEWNVHVLRKGFDLPNIGREATSYFKALVDLYDWLEPGDYVACCQGNPADHCPDLFYFLRQRPERFAWLGDQVYTCDANGAPHAPGLKMNYWLGRLLSQPERTHFDFVPGGQFIVSAEAVYERPRGFYEEMYREGMEDESGIFPYAFERLWGYVWNP